MKLPQEFEIQEGVEKLLEKRELFPFMVFYTSKRDSDTLDTGVLGVSFYLQEDLEELLTIIDYKSICDKSGYVVIPEYNTLIITSGSGIIDLWSKL